MRNLFRAAANVLRKIPGRTARPATDLHSLLQYATRLHQSGQFDEARSICLRAVEVAPESDVAHNLLGVVLCTQGRLPEGESAFRHAIAANNSNADAWNNLANVRKDLGDLRSAEQLYLQTLERKPQFGAAANNLGLLFFETGRLEDAARWFRHAVSVDGGHADAHNNLGTVLRLDGRVHEAEAEFRHALAVDPCHVEALCGLGDVLNLIGSLDEAELYCRRALKLRPLCVDALNNLATIEKSRGRTDDAIAYCDQALQAHPTHIAALNNRGSLAARKGDYIEAEAIYRRALTIDPRRSITRFNLAATLLMLGDYIEGFNLYESRFEAFKLPYRPNTALDTKLRSLPRWQGEPIGRGNLLLWSEQGLGDTVMMLRYLPELRSRGIKQVTVLCDRQLGRVVREMGIADHVLLDDDEAVAIEFSYHSPMMSLPWAFHTCLDSVPQTIPYLSAPPAMVAAWRGRLSGARPKVGLAWAGTATLRDDALRSIPLAQFVPVLAIRNIEFISLQKGDRAKEWFEVVKGDANPIAECKDLLDTAALIKTLDLVISVDTSIAHLAGALGKPVWLLNRFSSEWRWGLHTQDSLWYPSMKILREPHGNGWDVVISRIVTDLKTGAFYEPDGDV